MHRSTIMELIIYFHVRNTDPLLPPVQAAGEQTLALPFAYVQAAYAIYGVPAPASRVPQNAEVPPKPAWQQHRVKEVH